MPTNPAAEREFFSIQSDSENSSDENSLYDHGHGFQSRLSQAPPMPTPANSPQPTPPKLARSPATTSRIPSASSLPLNTSNTHSTPAGKPLRPFYSQASRSQSYLGPPAFAPPFYNRPPTPLPPSPSLTSLLRPPLPFGTYGSRPNTPDSSDTEATHQTQQTATTLDPSASKTSLLHPATALSVTAATATTVPRASPKVPTYEYYGFVLYLGSSLAFLMYLLWSFLPMPFLHALGIYYYPNRWWSLAVPAWLVMLLVYIYVALAAYNVQHLTLPMASLEAIVDAKGRVAVIDAQGTIIRTDRFKEVRREGTNEARDARKRELKAKESKRKKDDGGGKEGSGASAGTPATKEEGTKPRPRGRKSATTGMVESTPVKAKKAKAVESREKTVYGRTGLEGMDEEGALALRPLMWESLWSEGTDAVMDVPIGGVCEILYGDARASEREREKGPQGQIVEGGAEVDVEVDVGGYESLE